LFGLSYQSIMPVAKRQAWTAQQKWYVIDLKRKGPNKKLDDIIIAVKAKFERDVSASTLHGWLKPESAAKIEQLVNASGQNSTYKRTRMCDFFQIWMITHIWSMLFFFGTRGTKHVGQP
jgi:hypothetical protein